LLIGCWGWPACLGQYVPACLVQRAQPLQMVAMQREGRTMTEDLDVDLDDEDQPIVKPAAKGPRKLRTIVHAVTTLRRIAPLSGITFRHRIRRSDKEYRDLDDEEKAFVSKVISNADTMVMSTKIMHGFDEDVKIKIPNQDKDDRNFLLELLSLGMYQVKFHVIRHIWDNFVRPQNTELKDLQERFKGLRQQFQHMRTNYLSELYRHQKSRRLPEQRQHRRPFLVELL